MSKAKKLLIATGILNIISAFISFISLLIIIFKKQYFYDTFIVEILADPTNLLTATEITQILDAVWGVVLIAGVFSILLISALATMSIIFANKVEIDALKKNGALMITLCVAEFLIGGIIPGILCLLVIFDESQNVDEKYNISTTHAYNSSNTIDNTNNANNNQTNTDMGANEEIDITKYSIQIQKLKKLKEQGVIDDNEYIKMLNDLLNK